MINLLREKIFVGRHKESQKGTTAVEMALIAPVFIMMFTGLADVSLMMLAQHVMENATFNASRLGKTGYTPEGVTQEETVLAALRTELNGMYPLIDMNKISFTYKAYKTFGEVGQEGKGSVGLGGAQEVVVYTVSYPWKFFAPVVGEIMGGEDSTLTLTSKLVVRNEPY